MLSGARTPRYFEQLFSKCAAQPDNKILGQCLLVGQEVACSGLNIDDYGGVYQYLRPLKTAEALATLTEYLSKEKLFTPEDEDKLMAHS